MPAQHADSISATPSNTSRFVERIPVFYGWVVTIVAGIGLIATSPGQSFTVFLFIDIFIDEFNLSRTTISGLYGAGTFIAALALTWVGGRIDRHGNRAAGVMIAGLFTVSLFYMSFVSSPLMLLIGFIMIRGLGQGSMTLVSSTAVANWFMKRRGRVMSLILIAFFLFQSVYVPQVESLLSRYEWREVWRFLAIGIALIVIPAFGLLMRNRPEDFGLTIDGEVTNEDIDVPDEDHWSLYQARHTVLFWVYLLGRVISPAWGTGLIIHQVSVFENLGYERHVAAETFGLVAILTAALAIFSGYLVDRYSAGLIMSFQLVGLISAMALATIMTESWMLYLYALAFAVVMGTGAVFDGSVWANLFGRKHQGAIRGFVTTALVIGTSIGPLAFGVSYDVFGSYTPVLILGIILAAIPAVWAPFVTLPLHDTVHDS